MDVAKLLPSPWYRLRDECEGGVSDRGRGTAESLGRMGTTHSLTWVRESPEPCLCDREKEALLMPGIRTASGRWDEEERNRIVDVSDFKKRVS